MLTRNQKRRLGISTTQLNNLIILHNGLIDLYPKKYKRGFRMQHYCSDALKSVINTIFATKEHPCKTVACAGGHGPSCGIPFIENEIIVYDMDKTIDIKERMRGVRWDQYLSRVFGADSNSSLWRFLFSSSWDTYQHREIQMEQAIARLRMVITTGVPIDFSMRAIYDTDKLTEKLPKASYKD